MTELGQGEARSVEPMLVSPIAGRDPIYGLAPVFLFPQCINEELDWINLIWDVGIGGSSLT